MDFSFSDEQEQLRREARAFLAANPEPAWERLAELGWLGVSLPEEQGGAGLGFLEEAVLWEELGRALVPGPYFATFALAAPALGGYDGRRWSVELDGGLVPNLGEVDRVLTASGPVAPDGAVLQTLDETRPYGRLARPGGAAAIDRPRAFAALALEAVGVAAKALELGVEHARTREQFGKPIGVYQAVSHRLADTYVEVELARSLAYWAAWCVSGDDAEAPLAAAAAKAFCAEAAVAACERSIQVHGGIGFTWEHPLHRYYKRAQWIASFAASPAALRAEVAGALVDVAVPA